jgi:syntaxin 8
VLEQDEHLDRLSHSISRQHHISLQINDELDVHAGLLEELDTDLERTETMMTSARRRLDRVAKGAKDNGQLLSVIFMTRVVDLEYNYAGSTVAIAALILVLLILIIVFKT